MDYDETLTDVRDYFTARLGDGVAGQLVDLARPGFTLEEAAPGDATGHCRFGGRALLEPGTPWPMYEDMPLSLLAVLDADELAPWMGKEFPSDAGFLNFFYLDGHSAHYDPHALELMVETSPWNTRLGAVVSARADRAEAVEPPARSTVFEPIPWRAVPGIVLPDLDWDPAVPRIDLGPDVNEIEQLLPAGIIEESIQDWDEQPGRIDSRSADVAFGWPSFYGGCWWAFPRDEAPEDYRQLLQLTGSDQWRIGGEGGWMHYSIPADALRAGDFAPHPAILVTSHNGREPRDLDPT